MKAKAERNKLICAAYESGQTCAEVAKEFGITTSRVWVIIRRSGVQTRNCGSRPLATKVQAKS